VSRRSSSFRAFVAGVAGVAGAAGLAACSPRASTPASGQERTPVTHASDAADAASSTTVKLLANLTGPHGTHLAFDRDGKQWALADHHSIQLGHDGALDRKLAGSAEPILDLAWSADDKQLLAGAERYDLERDAWQQRPALTRAMNDALTFELADPPSPDQLAIVAAAASADGKDLVIAARFMPSRELGAVDDYRGPSERLIVVSSSGTGDAERTARGVIYAGSSEMRAIAVGEQLIAAGGDIVQVWDRKTLRKVAELPHKLVARALAFNAAGDRLAVISAAGAVTVWNPQTGEQLSSFQAHQIDGYTIAFHPTRPLLATGGQDGKLRLWSLEGRPVYEEFLGGWVQAVAFAPNGTRLAASTWARPPHLMIYEVSTP
jgi:WD40 repeat protein